MNILGAIFDTITGYWPQLRDTVIDAVLKYLPLLVAVVAFMSWLVTRRWFCRTLKERIFLLRCIPALKKYFEKERAWLSARPSLTTTSTIDFASRYVELVMIAQPHTGMYHAKQVVEVKEVLDADNPAIIVSAAGCGKTTLLLHMHYLLLQAQTNRLNFRKRSIPILLEAQEIVHHGTTLSKQILTKFASLDEEKAQRLVKIGLKRGLFVLLIDSIDQISEPIPGVIKKICDFVTENPRCQVILASRPVSYDLELLTKNKVRPFSGIAIAPLSYEKKKALVEKYAHSADHARIVLQAISTKDFLKEITHVAINLLLCIEPLASGSEKLTKRSDFYRVAVRTLLREWPRRNGVHLEYSTPDKEELLSRVCFAVLVDGRLFVKRNLQADYARRYDVVILNLPDPSTAQLNRLYTVEFFDMIGSTLNQDGVFSFRVGSAENYISGELRLYLSSLYNTLKSVFAEVKVLPGANAVFLASNETGALFDQWEIMAARLKDRRLTTHFVNQNFLPDRLSPLRLALLDRGLSGKAGKLNSDLVPICYFYNSVLWSKQFGSVEKQILLYLSDIGWFWLITGLGVLFALLFVFCLMPGSQPSNLALAAIFVAGFTSILVEIVVVLSFQTFHGYVYSTIGLIFTLFMSGLFLGTVIIQRTTSRTSVSFRGLIRVQLLQVLFLTALLAAIPVLAKSSIPDWVILPALLLIICISGILGGMLFVLANHLFLGRRSTRKAGTGYAVDLFGSSLSSLVASAILIPLLGIPASLIAILLVNLICLFALLMVPRIS